VKSYAYLYQAPVQRIDVRTGLNNTLVILQHKIRAGVDVMRDYAQDLPEIEAYGSELNQVWTNIIDNAVDAMGGRGALEVRAERTDDGGVRVTICDNGPGISSADVPHLFEPFFTTKEFGKGTGLGLSTVFGIVKQHDGCIGVVSTVDRGTTLTIYFPEVERHNPVAIRETPAEARPMGHETILIAEDSDALRALVAKMLTNCGYHTIVARDAREAMQLSGEFDGPIHLLVTDVVMPGPDGPELSRELKRARTETRVLYMSGHTDRMMADHGLEGHGVQFLQKPFSLDALARKVRHLLEAPEAAVR
jgi:two-component system, cell cycle sensor histidine kinase and response regulator CckA